MHQNGGSIVWSPFSNLILYGGTTDVQTAIQLGVNVALGSDWAPTASKNLLNELKVARILSDDQQLGLSDLQLVEMVTVNPARMLGWQGSLGSIEPNRLADIAVVAGKTGDPYRHLVDATETDIRLVVIGGVARYGTPALLAKLSPVDEQFDVAGNARAFHLDTHDPDPVLGPMSLGDAATALADALEHMPERAAAIGSAVRLGGPWPDGEPGRGRGRCRRALVPRPRPAADRRPRPDHLPGHGSSAPRCRDRRRELRLHRGPAGPRSAGHRGR